MAALYVTLNDPHRLCLPMLWNASLIIHEYDVLTNQLIHGRLKGKEYWANMRFVVNVTFFDAYVVTISTKIRENPVVIYLYSYKCLSLWSAQSFVLDVVCSADIVINQCYKILLVYLLPLSYEEIASVNMSEISQKKYFILSNWKIVPIVYYLLH